MAYYLAALAIETNEAAPQTAEMYGGGSGRRFMTGSGKNQSQWTA
jgi:hypothetical protein